MLDTLAEIPRVSLAHLPTPLEPLPRLSEALGIEVWVKRDDATGLACGGNKVRKLEFLLAEAREDGADRVLTIGGVQSNHARQTAAACARLGLPCQLVLPRMVPRRGSDYEANGNILLDQLFGAELFIEADAEAAGRRIQILRDDAAARGERMAIFPPGGSTPTGSLGYVAAAVELDEQLRATGLDPRAIYLACSTAGTAAGLACGLSALGRRVPLRAACVAGTRDETEANFAPLAQGVCERLGIEPPPANALELRDRFLGDGYGIPGEASLEAIRLCARLEGLLIDPVYTAKAMAALIHDAREGQQKGPVVFWHTGGIPGNFAYRSELL